MILLSSLTFSNCESSKKATASENTITTQEEVNSNGTSNLKKVSKDDIVGSWEWVKTDCCGRTSKTTYADPKNEKRVISFKSDGTAMYYTNDPEGKIAQQKYSLSTMGTQATIQIGDLRPAIFYVNEDMLTLSWGYMDLQIEYYKRVE